MLDDYIILQVNNLLNLTDYLLDVKFFEQTDKIDYLDLINLKCSLEILKNSLT